MTRKSIRPVLAVLLLAGTVAAFAYYIIGHPETVHQLRRLSLPLLGGLLLLYAVFMLTVAWIQQATLSLCNTRLDRRESLLLVSYSSIINFFGPLQSGPAFRAAYLKRKHGVKLKSYALATLLHYAFFAAFSGLFIMTFFVGLWTLVAVCIIAICVPVLLRSRPGIVPERFRHLRLRHAGALAAATLAQVTMTAVIFFVELNSLGRQAAALPALIYTGVANFAMFVSVTPGAIGFRESFLLFSQRLHGFSSDHIITASLIDRGLYILFLGVLAALVFGFHAQRRLTSTAKSASPVDTTATTD